MDLQEEFGSGSLDCKNSSCTELLIFPFVCCKFITLYMKFIRQSSFLDVNLQNETFTTYLLKICKIGNKIPPSETFCLYLPAYFLVLFGVAVACSLHLFYPSCNSNRSSFLCEPVHIHGSQSEQRELERKVQKLESSPEGSKH